MRRFLSIVAFVLLATIIGIGYRQLGLAPREAPAVTGVSTLPVTVVQEAISSAPLSSSSFSGDAAVGTVIGTIAPTLNPSASFNGTVTLSTTQGGCTAVNGINNPLFQVVGNTNLETNALNPGGTYQVCYLVTQTGANNSPLGFPVTLTASQTLQTIALSNNTVASGSSGATVGTLSTTMSPASPAFSGSYSLSNGTGCANPSSTNFQVAGSTLETNAALTNGTYCIVVSATQGGISNSPISQAETITASGAQQISAVNLSNNSFNGGSPSGTVVGNYTVVMNPSSPAFTGTLAFSTTSGGCTTTTGANNASFQLVGSSPWVLETNGVIAAGTYAVCVVATESGTSNSPFGASFTIQGQPQTISTITLSNNSFTGGSASGTSVGTISVTMSPSLPAFNGTLSLSTSVGGCTATNGANNSDFQIVGSTLETNGVVAAGTYAACIVATESGTTNSPLGLPVTIIGTASAFFVAVGGSDSNAGTLASPFATLGKCQSAMQSSGTKTCYVRGGTYTSLPSVTVGTYTAALYLTSSDNGETWSYYPSDGYNTAILDGGSTVANPGVMGTETCTAYYTCAPSSGSQTCTGGIFIAMWIDGGSNITINGFAIQNFNRGGIDVHGGAAYHTIEPNSVANATGNTVENNIIHGMCGAASQFSMDAGVAVEGNAQNTIVTNNAVYNVTAMAIRADANGDGSTPSDNISGTVFKYNHVYNASLQNFDNGALYIDDNNHSATGLTITNNYVGFSGLAGNSSFSCPTLVVGCDGHGIYTDNGTSNVTITYNILQGPASTNLFMNGGSGVLYNYNILDAGTAVDRQTMANSGSATYILQHNVVVANNSSFGSTSLYYFTGSGTRTMGSNGYYNDNASGNGVLTSRATSDGDTGPTALTTPFNTCPGGSINSWGYVLNAALGSPVSLTQPSGWATPGYWGPPGYTIPHVGFTPSYAPTC